MQKPCPMSAVRQIFQPLDQSKTPGTLPCMKHADRITFNPKQCGGRPCIRGMRIQVKDVLNLMAARVPEAEILADYPDLELEDIQACIEYAAAQVDHPVLIVHR